MENIIIINGVEYIRRNTEGQKVLIRSGQSGVHFGTLIEKTLSGGFWAAKLVNARRIHYWEGAASLSQIAVEGAITNASRVAIPEPEKEIGGVCEIIPLSDVAILHLEKMPVWKI